MAAAARPAASGVAEDWILPIEAVEAWLRRAKPGDRLIYAGGRQLVRGEASSRLRELEADSEVMLFHRRNTGGGGFDYLAVRNRVRLVNPTPRRQEGPILDAAQAAVLLKLKAVARAGERCPSDRELGEALGLTAPQVKWAMRRLIDAKVVESRIEPTPRHPKYRVVTIVANGAQTRMPGASK